MPPKKVKKPKKPVQQKQKQKQSQRVVVNVNQPKRAAVKRRQTRQPQQVVYQPLITMSGSVPVPQPYYNPSPVQSSAGFAPTAPTPSLGTPTSLSSPVVLPSFAGEETVAIGGEDVAMPALAPVREPTPEPIVVPAPVYRPPPASIINENRPVIRTPPPLIAPSPIIRVTPSPPASVPDSRFISQPPSRADDNKSVSTLLSEISRDTGINSKSVADFLFKKKKQPIPSPPPSVAREQPQILSLINPNQLESNSIFPSTTSSGISSLTDVSVASSDMSVPETILTDTTKADYLFLDDRSIPAPESISSMSGFNPPSEKSSIKKKPIIAEPKEPVVIKKPELKRADPYDPFSIFSDNESIARDTPIIEPSGDIASDAATQGTYKKPAKKREVVLSSGSERDVNIIPLDKPAGRRIPPTKLAPVKEKKSSYQSKADLQLIAKDKKINLLRPNGKEKTMNELRLELSA